MVKSETEVGGPGALVLRTPLMAFPTVSRRTGILRKHCIVENTSGGPIVLDVRFDFPEHSWLQVVVGDLTSVAAELTMPRSAPEARADQVVVPPGESWLDVLVDTDNSNFPFGRFHGVIELVPVATDGKRLAGVVDGLATQQLSLSFEEIVDLEDFNGYAAVDLGTNSAAVAVYHRRRDAGRGTTWNPDLDTSIHSKSAVPNVPAAVLVRDLAALRELVPGACAVGRQALADYRARPDADPHALLIGSKRHLGRRRILAADLRGSASYIAPEDVVYQLGRFVRQQCQNNPKVQARLPRLMLTYPPTWDQGQLDRWKGVFRRLGYRDEDLDLSLDEASAVGLFYLHEWTRDPDTRDRLLQDLWHDREEIVRGESVGERYTLRMLCFDFGGGTIDLAHVRADLELFGESLHIRLELCGSDSLPYGGDQVTLAVFRILKRRIAMALADPDRFVGHKQTVAESVPQPAAPGLFLLPSSASAGATEGQVDARAAAVVNEHWDRLAADIGAATLPPEVEEAVERLIPTRFRPDPDAPLVPVAKRNFAWLWDRAETLKCELFQAAQNRSRDVALSADDGADVRMGFALSQLPDEVRGRPAADHPTAQAQVTVSVAEVYSAIEAPLRDAVMRARRLVGSQRPDRIVLAGQSSWIPLVRQMFARPRSEGGLGLAPGKIEFDPEHAKTAVSRGACLLPVMREALVGLSVDVSEFRVALLHDLYYQSPMGRHRELFRAGPIRDFEPVEDEPDPASFARYLTVFSGDAGAVLGQFDFGSDGARLPSWDEHGARARDRLGLDFEFPTRSEFDQLAAADPDLHRRLTDAIALWPESVVVAWVESDATPGTSDRPRYRYYLTRSRRLLAVRHGGDDDVRLFELDHEAGANLESLADIDPFSGGH